MVLDSDWIVNRNRNREDDDGEMWTAKRVSCSNRIVG